jgi:DNA-binding NarL/FixJ family response regulator
MLGYMDQKLLDKLTLRELAVAKGVGQGLANKEIGARLGIRENTVKAYLGRVFEKLDVSSRLQLALLVAAQ